MRATTTTCVAIALLLGSPMLAGCGGNGSSNPPEPLPDPGGGGAAATTFTFSASDCPAHYPLPLTVSTAADQERPYIKKVVACTSDEQYGPLWLHNVGNEVWTLDNERATYKYLDNTLSSYAFFITFGNNGDTRLSPEDKLLVQAPPGQVSWTLSPAYTAAWDTQTEALEQVKAYGETAFLAAVKKNTSQEHAALATCTLAGYKTAETWTGDPDAFDENFGAVLGTSAGVAGCAATWKSAWQRDFQSASGFLEKVDTRFRLFSTFGEHALVMVR